MPDIAALLTFENGVALLTLTLLEIVLGIDNIVFIAILTGKLDAQSAPKARKLGLAMAMGMRILLLLLLSWIMGLTKPLFEYDLYSYHIAVSGRDLILLFGGLFLIAKSTYEIHDKIEGHGDHGISQKRAVTFTSVIIQIMLLDIVFSLDSVITAVGMANEIIIMILAVIIAVGVMLVFAETVSKFVERHPTVKMLALSFLLLIGMMLVAEGFHAHIPKGYVYFAMAFSLFVEMLNLRVKSINEKKVKP
ncbi:MAG: membrane protein [Candidatus Hydrogenedentota bacterium]